jgi:hypothetical protein
MQPIQLTAPYSNLISLADGDKNHHILQIIRNTLSLENNE